MRPDTLFTAVAKALGEHSLIDALTYICVWESERVVDQAINRHGSGSDGAGWDTCFKICLQAVIGGWMVECNHVGKVDWSTQSCVNCGETVITAREAALVWVIQASKPFPIRRQYMDAITALPDDLRKAIEDEP